MKNFKEFKRDFKEIIKLEEDEDVYAAYECYLLGFVDGKEEAFKVMLSAPITMPNVPMPNVPMPNVPFTFDTQAQLLHEEAEKMEEK